MDSYDLHTKTSLGWFVDNWAMVSMSPLQWRHPERDGVSNHQPHDGLLKRLFKAKIKENIKALRHWPLCGEFTGDR